MQYCCEKENIAKLHTKPKTSYMDILRGLLEKRA